MKPILLFVMIILYSCSDIAELVAPIDFVPTNPIDTTVIDTPEQIIVLDTCHELVNIDTPAFTVLTIHFFNGQPVNEAWNIQGQFDTTFTDLAGMLEYMYPQYEYTVYKNNNSVSVIVDGVTNNNLFQGLIWTRDAVDQKAFMTAFGRAFYWWGALTFEEAIFEAKKRPSVTSFHFTNTNWTAEQNNMYAREILNADLCKEGEYIANFKNADGIIPTLKDSFNLFDWEFVQQLNDQLIRA